LRKEELKGRVKWLTSFSLGSFCERKKERKDCKERQHRIKKTEGKKKRKMENFERKI